MRYSWLLVLMLLGIILMGAIPAGAASGAGPYYATPSWDQTMPDSTRFVTLTNFNNEAVLDRETGLVWEAVLDITMPWGDAMWYSTTREIGDRGGWRLPSVAELRTIFNTAGQNFVRALYPSAHVWTSDIWPYDSDQAYAVQPNGTVDHYAKSSAYQMLFVRGPR